MCPYIKQLYFKICHLLSLYTILRTSRIDNNFAVFFSSQIAQPNGFLVSSTYCHRLFVVLIIVVCGNFSVETTPKVVPSTHSPQLKWFFLVVCRCWIRCCGISAFRKSIENVMNCKSIARVARLNSWTSWKLMRFFPVVLAAVDSSRKPMLNGCVVLSCFPAQRWEQVTPA